MTSGIRKSDRRAATASTARRDRRQARIASSLPILRDRTDSGVSISYCTSAVEATVEPFTGSSLRSTTTTPNPASASASAIIAPVMPAPMTSTSVLRSLRSPVCRTLAARRPSQTERPVLKFRFVVTMMSCRQSEQP
jgi:hypothetical protein